MQFTCLPVGIVMAPAMVVVVVIMTVVGKQIDPDES